MNGFQLRASTFERDIKIARRFASNQSTPLRERLDTWANAIRRSPRNFGAWMIQKVVRRAVAGII